MAIFNGLEFDSESSLDNNIYITADTVFDAPERDVEAVEIPGRNGAFLLDKGRWKNVEVTYKAGVFGVDQDQFANKIRNYRNILSSRIGYKRLTDTYHPDEFRLAQFRGPFEADTTSYNRHGEFDIKFDCKPQRFLTSGEHEITVTSGDEITNPTPYESSPLLLINGYGNIEINGYDIDIVNEEFGTITLWGNIPDTSTRRITNYYTNSPVNPADNITLSALGAKIRYKAAAGYTIVSTSKSSGSGSWGVVNGEFVISFSKAEQSFTSGTDHSYTVTSAGTFTVKRTGTSTQYTTSAAFQLDIVHTASTKSVTYSLTMTTTPSATYVTRTAWYLIGGSATADSTVSILGNPLYIDCDLGEAYKIQSGEVVPLNDHIDLGSDLPVLSPGANDVTFDNTVNQLRIVPRWWIL